MNQTQPPASEPVKPISDWTKDDWRAFNTYLWFSEHKDMLMREMERIQQSGKEPSPPAAESTEPDAAERAARRIATLKIQGRVMYEEDMAEIFRAELAKPGNATEPDLPHDPIADVESGARIGPSIEEMYPPMTDYSRAVAKMHGLKARYGECDWWHSCRVDGEARPPRIYIYSNRLLSRSEGWPLLTHGDDGLPITNELAPSVAKDAAAESTCGFCYGRKLVPADHSDTSEMPCPRCCPASHDLCIVCHERPPCEIRGHTGKLCATCLERAIFDFCDPTEDMSTEEIETYLKENNISTEPSNPELKARLEAAREQLRQRVETDAAVESGEPDPRGSFNGTMMRIVRHYEDGNIDMARNYVKFLADNAEKAGCRIFAGGLRRILSGERRVVRLMETDPAQPSPDWARDGNGDAPAWMWAFAVELVQEMNFIRLQAIPERLIVGMLARHAPPPPHSDSVGLQSNSEEVRRLVLAARAVLPFVSGHLTSVETKELRAALKPFETGAAIETEGEAERE